MFCHALAASIWTGCFPPPETGMEEIAVKRDMGCFTNKAQLGMNARDGAKDKLGSTTAWLPLLIGMPVLLALHITITWRLLCTLLIGVSW